jgi:hypothetical protein
LVTLRSEFNAISPNRDKGADGSIGDSNHTSSSDHTPDEDSRILEDHDADHKNEVHATDIDSSGPWPGEGTQKQRFDRKVKKVIAEEKKKWLDDNDMCRLNYVIWDEKIYDKDNDFEPRDYDGHDPHTNHAHFSSRYETRAENDTRPFGVANEEDEMELTDKITLTADAADAVGGKAGDQKTVETTLLLMLIYSSRANKAASAAKESAAATAKELSNVKAELEALKAATANAPVGSGGTVDVNAIAKAVADENARRQAE